MSTATNWEGRLMRRYGGMVNPLPSPNTIADYLPFIPERQRPGDTYEVAVDLGFEKGVTRNVDGSSYTFNSARDSISKPARLSGSNISVIGDIPRSMLFQMKTAARTNGDMSGMDMKVKQTARGAEFARELDLHYGPGSGAVALDDIGVVSAIISGTNLGAGGPVVVDITRASFAPGLWNLWSGGLVDVVESDLTTVVETDVEVTYVKSAGYTRLSLSKSGVTTDVDATDVLLPAGAIAKSCTGIRAILNNTGSLFGISAATYPQWMAEQYAVGGALSKAKIFDLAARLQNNGLTNGGRLWVAPAAFAGLCEEVTDLQRFAEAKGGTSPMKRVGAQNIEVITPAGVIEVVNDLLMKQSLGFFLGRDKANNPVGKRVGTTDNTFDTGDGDGRLFQRLGTSAGSRLECYSNQAPLLTVPWWCAQLTGITNTGDYQPA